MSKLRSKKVFAMNDDHSLIDPLAEIMGILEGIEEEPTSVVSGGEVAENILPITEILQEDQGAGSIHQQADEVVQELSGMKKGQQIYMVGIRQLEGYPDQPFHAYSPERLQDLAEDIGRVGILSPILARRVENKLQILAGHNRWAAAALAGLAEVPVILLEADDDLAALIVTTTNLRQREKLLYSEKAFAYKLQMDALKRQGQKTGKHYNAAGFITQQTGDSRMQIHRYIRLTELEPELLELLDKGKISMTPAVAVSYLASENQRQVLGQMQALGVGLTIEKANLLKNMAVQAGGEALPRGEIEAVMQLERRKKAVASSAGISLDRIQKYLPKGTKEEEVEGIIIQALRAWNEGKR